MHDVIKYAITLENVNKWYGKHHVLKDINLSIKEDRKSVV